MENADDINFQTLLIGSSTIVFIQCHSGKILTLFSVLTCGFNAVKKSFEIPNV